MLRRIFLIMTSLCCINIVVADNIPTISQAMNTIINNSEFKNANVGIAIQSPDHSKILYQRNANTVFTPASTTKIFTAIAALKYLGANYTFPTQALIADPITPTGNLPGNLYLKFTGDPTLTVNDLEQFLKELAKKNVHEIDGNIAIDDTTLGGTYWAPGVNWNALPTHWAAPATAIVINENYFTARLSSSNKIGVPGILKISPTMTGVTISNQTIVKQAPTWQCPLDLTMDDSNNYVITGCVAPNTKAIPLKIAFSNPRLALKNILNQLLHKQGIVLKGGIIFSSTPKQATILVQHNSDPLELIVKTMLKESNNLFAEILLKTLGANYFSTAGTWGNGVEAMKRILASSGVDFNQIEIKDGAGLSHYNAISPMQLLNLLNYANDKLPEKDIFYQSLPIGHIDGTLKNRFQSQYEGQVHAKTGSMVNISSLAGYVQTNQKHTLAFTIMVNNFCHDHRNKKVEALEDSIVEYLIQNE